jgi:hypothetical protein
VFCSFASQWAAGWGHVSCQGTVGFWPDGAALLVAALALGIALHQLSGRAVAKAAMLALAGVMLALAAQQPELALSPQNTGPGGLAVLVLDSSESVWRDPERPHAALQALAALVQKTVAGLGLEQAAVWQTQVVRFAAAAGNDGPAQPLDALTGMIRGLNVASPGDQSNGSAGLGAALDLIRSHGGRGAVFLVSDGHFDAPVLESLVNEAAALGVPVHVMATGSQRPAAGLVAADIGPEQWVGRPVPVRLSFTGGGELTVRQGPIAATTLLPPSTSLAAARVETAFASRGLRSVQLELGHQQKTLFTLVRGPARVLIYGPAAWTGALDPALWLVERGDPAEPKPAADYDVVVIDALVPADFKPGFDTDLLKAADGTGILIINGGLRGTKEQPQRIADWNDSALSPILPVDSDPRKFVQEPPPRDVVVMIDVSGSMGGGPLYTSAAVTKLIMAQLRPIDTIAILPFAGGSNPAFTRRSATVAAIADAAAFVDGLQAEGSTDPTAVLQDAGALASNYCAFFFLSDGYFDPPNIAPQCHTIGVPVAGEAFPNGTVWLSEELTALLPGSLPANLKLAYFKPDERTEYFRDSSFMPMAEGSRPDLVPPLAVDGLAISYPRVDATVISLHPDRPRDPLLALRRDAQRPGISTGVFLSDIPAIWATDGAGKAALASMLTELTGWTAMNRYDIRLTEQEGQLSLTVRILDVPKPGESFPATVNASILTDTGQSIGVNMRAAGEPGDYGGTVPLPYGDADSRGLLVLQEADQPIQRIPLYLPAASAGGAISTDEGFAYGIDRVALDRVASATGGMMLDANAPMLEPPVQAVPTWPLFPWLLALAALCMAGAFWIGGRQE